VCGHRQVRRRFRGRVYVITVGRDVRSRAEIAAKVADAAALITGDTATPATDPDAAGAHLGRLLQERPRTLLVLDDVWEERQLKPFLIGAPHCVRLITTRNNHLLPDSATRIHVDQMTPEQAQQLLTRGLPRLPAQLVQDLLQATGRWALLLQLANGLLTRHVDAGTDALDAAEDLLQQLRQRGPSAADAPTGSWDMNDPDLRNLAVEASVEASTTLLPAGADTRFGELGIFAEDEPIPLTLAAALWRTTGGLSLAQTRLMCQDLARLSLITYDPAAGRIGLHDVVRDYLRSRTNPNALRHLHTALIDSTAATLPTTTPLAPGTPHPDRGWWQTTEGYLLDHLITHLLAAGQTQRAEAVTGDIRWIETRLAQRGPNAPWQDLTRINTPRSLDLAHILAQNAHLLIPVHSAPEYTAIHQLHARIHHHPHWRPQIQARRTDPQLLPCLVPRWPLPDITTAQRTLTGDTGRVWAVAWSADGRLAIGGHDGSVRVWDATAATSTELTGHTGPVWAVAWSTDGRLATGSEDGSVRVWDVAAATSSELIRHTGWVRSVAWSTDGRLATGGHDGSVRVWDATATTSTELTRHTGPVWAVAWSTDGRLATGGHDGWVRVWDATAATSTRLTGHTGSVWAVAWSADGRLATGGHDGWVRVWDATAATSTELSGHTRTVLAVAWSADGRLATGGEDGSVRVWDVAAATSSELTGHTGSVWAVAWSADGRLATGGEDGSVRVWDVAAATSSELTGHTGRVWAVAWSADGRLATGGEDGSVRVWDVAAATSTRLTGHTGWVRSVAWSADGRLATGGEDGSVRIWDVAAATSTELIRHTHLLALTKVVDHVTVGPLDRWCGRGEETVAAVDRLG
jgi:WD40 repeat protein